MPGLWQDPAPVPSPVSPCSGPVSLYADPCACVYAGMALAHVCCTLCAPGEPASGPDHGRLEIRPSHPSFFRWEDLLKHFGIFSYCGNLNRRAWGELHCHCEKASRFIALTPHTTSPTWGVQPGFRNPVQSCPWVHQTRGTVVKYWP